MKLKKLLGMFAIVLSLSAFGTFSMPDDADARRLGGGRSFGRTTTVKPTPPAGVTTNQQQNFQQQRAMGNNVGGAAAINRGGMFGGLFGGLLAGTLLGSLLSGTGFAGAGGFLDIIIIGLIVYFGFRFFKNRRQNANTDYQENNYRANNYQAQDFRQQNDFQNSSSAWDNLRSERTYQNVSQQFAGSEHIPASFNTEEFLEGAKKLYVRMQESWDMRDLNDIRQFTAPIMYQEIEEQYKQDPNPSKTELLLVNASVLGVNQEGDHEQVAVLFDVLMKEQENASSEQVKEIWNFSRNTAEKGSWLLDGIQQL